MRWNISMWCVGVVVVFGIVAAQEAQRPSQPAQPTVMRDEVNGAIAHGSGNSKWTRVIGKVKVHDARTLEFADGTRVELDIHSPPLEQLVLDDRTGKFYSCGHEAAEFVRELVGDQTVIVFRPEGPALAYVGDMSLEHTLVVNGWALADHSSLHAPEIIARENKRGLWRGKFIVPDEWRKGQRLPGEDAAAKSATPPRHKNDPSVILGRWNSLDRHVAMGSLFQPVHGVRKREAVVVFEKSGEQITGYAVMADHKAISNQQRWKDGRTEFRKLRFDNNRLTFEFPVGEWFETAGPIAVEDKRLANQGTIRVDATLHGDRLVGRWRMFLADETEIFRGEWEATRAAQSNEQP